MVAPIYTNRKGIYIDLYREIDSDNKKKEIAQVQRPRRGIYVSLYKQIEGSKLNIAFKDKKEQDALQMKFVQTIQKNVNSILSKILCFHSYVASEIRMLLVAYVFVKRPIKNYLETKLPVYQAQEQNQGIYYND